MVEYSSGNNGWQTAVDSVANAAHAAHSIQGKTGVTKNNKWWTSRRIISLVAVIAMACIWMGVIYYFSDQDGTLSTKISNQTLVESGIISETQLNEFYYSPEMKALRKATRKLAHLGLYAVLGAIIAGFTRYGIGLGWRKVTHIALAVAGIYACFDEWHQSFVPGRAMTMDDVFIDLIGAAIGIGCLKLITLVTKRIMRRFSSGVGAQ